MRGIAWVQRCAVACTVLVVLISAPGLWRAASTMLNPSNLGSLVPPIPLAVAGPGLVLVMTFAAVGLMALWNEVAENG